jgi:hypothetical protein
MNDSPYQRLFAAVREWVADCYPGEVCVEIRLKLFHGKVVLPIPPAPPEETPGAAAEAPRQPQPPRRGKAARTAQPQTPQQTQGEDEHAEDVPG